MIRLALALLLLAIVASPARAWPSRPPLPRPPHTVVSDACITDGERWKCRVMVLTVGREWR